MSAAFFDTNVLLYTLAEGDRRQLIAFDLLSQGGAISVQVLTEFATVARRKLGLSWADVTDALAALRRLCTPATPLTVSIHGVARQLAERYQLSLYDALIAAAALDAGCTTLLSEDMHYGLVIDGRLTVHDRFRTHERVRPGGTPPPFPPSELQERTLVPIDAPPGLPGPVLDSLTIRAADYATRARGAGTRRTYRSAWTHFSHWCATLGREPLGGDPDLVGLYIVSRADEGLAVSSIRVAIAAIRTAHLLAGVGLDLSQPRFRMTLEGVVRSRGVRPGRASRASGAGRAAGHVDRPPLPDSPLAIRNRAMLLIGFGAALRRSGLVALRVGDVARVPGRGITVLVARSKTDQHGRGQSVAIWANATTPLACPLAALARWLALRDGAPDMRACSSAEARDVRPLFCGMSKAGRLSGVGLSDKSVVRLVKTASAAAGLDPERYSGHSLRAGLTTAAGDHGASLADLMRQTRHRSTEVALGYLRPADLWRNNVTERVFSGGKRRD